MHCVRPWLVHEVIDDLGRRPRIIATVTYRDVPLPRRRAVHPGAIPRRTHTIVPVAVDAPAEMRRDGATHSNEGSELVKARSVSALTCTTSVHSCQGQRVH